MKKCLACGNLQEAGNFCGSCGSSLVDVENTPTTSDQNPSAGTPVQPNEQVQPNQPYQQVPPVQADQQNQWSQPNQQFQQGQSNQQFQQFGQGQGQPNQQYQQYQQAPPQPNVHVERMKEQSTMFFNSFVEYLKKPSSIFNNGEREFINGIISLSIFVFIISLALFGAVNSTFGFFGNSFIIFLRVFFPALIIIALIVGVVLFGIFLISMWFGPNNSLKEVIGFLGALTNPVSMLAVLALLFSFIAPALGGNLITLSLVLAIFIVPLYIIGHLLSVKSKAVDSFYAYLIYVAGTSVAFFILMTIFTMISINSLMGGFGLFGGFGF
ncbi:hypothetical protein CD30_07160 [Ureibacillus massiliensis 4400831 = CIP 108448 = CCUG 49529]|uniref:Uncharacterized protein n=1 Tax=Ureibacillus massiliensis 4400831 = CIP 108448 = CCUG 49529 TaxID=1211035 RepID=A0A0A3J2P7_9BACL|nr:hypothetical protein [Ureibacillus massiliensis]KGR91216.1 hypothetical protein CD30_07160 [Ureibacillus massiliensis 4400831 = CIP 108448 = CCUG 49529]